MHKKIKGSAQVSQTKGEIQSLIPAAMLFPTVHMASILSNQPFLLCVSKNLCFLPTLRFFDAQMGVNTTDCFWKG